MQVKPTARVPRCILVSCVDPRDPQFDGMRRALGELANTPGVESRVWDGFPLPLSRRRRLTGLVLAGHGCEETAALGDGTGRRLAPRDVRLPAAADLFLLGCSQGREDLAAGWARGARLPADRVHGAEGETETLLSTLFILHLAHEGPDRLPELFGEWILANRLIRPFFAPARRLYRSTGGDPLAVLSYLRGIVDLGGADRFLSIAGSSAQYLAGLVAGQ